MHSRNQKLKSSSSWVRELQFRAFRHIYTFNNRHQAIHTEIVAVRRTEETEMTEVCSLCSWLQVAFSSHGKAASPSHVSYIWVQANFLFSNKSALLRSSQCTWHAVVYKSCKWSRHKVQPERATTKMGLFSNQRKFLTTHFGINRWVQRIL